MKTIATLFGGFEGVGVGAKAAGMEIAWSVENDAAIAAVADANLGKHVYVANILECDPYKFDAVDVLHASPECTRVSQANAKAVESPLDRRMAAKVAEFIAVLQPPLFTLENVWGYRNTKSWKSIEDALHKAGYWVAVEHVNCADYGVPQTRRRMIVRAVRGGFVPYLPEPQPWIGWYTAIEDLLDTLPESQFAPWQIERLPEFLMSTLVGSGGFDGRIAAAEQHEPAMTVTANENQLVVRAFLMAGGGNTNFVEAQPGKGCRYADEPAHTVVATSKEGGAFPRAFLISGQNDNPPRACGEPSYTITSTECQHIARAWLIDGTNANTNDQLSIRPDSEPALTVTAGGPKHPLRSLLDSGRVVAMTPRALARFQSFPDGYALPDNARLAAKGIGNAVPPLLYQRIIESLLATFN